MTLALDPRPSTLDHSVRGVLSHLESAFRAAGMKTARVDAEWLVASVLESGRAELYLADAPMSVLQVEQAMAWMQRRLAGEPLQYLVGFTEFCGHRVAVSPSVLIPRPETEGLVEEAVRWLRQRSVRAPVIVDAGTGSGNIAISLAAADETCLVVGIELSWTALCLARSNAQRCGVAERMQWVQADWLTALKGPVDLIVSNPPYVPTDQAHRLRAQADIGYEPWLSLNGGADGMVEHRRLLADAPRVLKAGGAVCMESSEAQAAVLADAARECSWVTQARVLHDAAGRPRGVWIQSA